MIFDVFRNILIRTQNKELFKFEIISKIDYRHK